MSLQIICRNCCLMPLRSDAYQPRFRRSLSSRLPVGRNCFPCDCAFADVRSLTVRIDSLTIRRIRSTAARGAWYSQATVVRMTRRAGIQWTIKSVMPLRCAVCSRCTEIASKHFTPAAVRRRAGCGIDMPWVRLQFLLLAN